MKGSNITQSETSSSIVGLPHPGVHLKGNFESLYSSPPSSGSKKRSQAPPSDAFAPAWLHKLVAPPEFAGGVTTPLNDRIPAGDTYIGQFLAHELTYQLADGIGQPSLQLDCLYGAGPDRAPYLYWYTPQPGGYNPYTFRGVKLALVAQEINGEIIGWDVKRVGAEGGPGDKSAPLALMADARNDRNFILLQLHCVWALFHNAVAQFLFDEMSDEEKKQVNQTALFKESRRLTVACFRQMVIYDYLAKLIDLDVIEEIWNNDEYLIFDPIQFNKTGQGYLKAPVLMREFLQAAFRLGHSQIREFYFLEWDLSKDKFNQRPPRRIFNFDNNSKSDDLGGFRQYRRQRIDWRLFFDYGPHAAISPQRSKAIDQYIAYPLSRLPFLPSGKQSLVSRDAFRSLQIAKGTAYASLLKSIPNKKFSDYANGIPKKIMDQLNAITDGKADEAPLWLYLMVEADALEKGKKLGPLGERIVAEQFVWVMKYSLHRGNTGGNMDKDLELDDKELFAAIKKLRNKGDGVSATKITMVDVLRFVGYTYPEVVSK
ncbi:MAG: heme peroxidase family protein [Saprospiraceae bacterium]